MQIDRVSTRIEIPADLSNTQAQAKLLVSITQAIAALLSASGMQSMQITVEEPGNGENMQVYVIPGIGGDDWQRLEAISQAMGAMPVNLPSGALH